MQREAVVSTRIDVASSITGLLPRLIERYTVQEGEKPYIHLLLGSEELYRLLGEDRLDFAITSVPFSSLDINWKPIQEDSVVLIVPEGHRFCGRESVTVNELAPERIVCNVNYMEKASINEMCLRSSFFPNIVVQGNEFLTADREIIPFRTGVMPVLGHTVPLIRSICAPGFEVVPIKGPFSKVTVGIAIKKSRPMSASARAFYDFALRELPSLITRAPDLK